MLEGGRTAPLFYAQAPSFVPRRHCRHGCECRRDRRRRTGRPGGRLPVRPPVRPIDWAEATPLVERLEQALPESLRAIPPSERPARWPGWLANRRKELAARVAQGDEDAVVNLLLFGTSFTKEPRITSSLLKELDQRWKAGDQSVQDTLVRHYQRRAPIWSRPPPIPARVSVCVRSAGCSRRTVTISPPRRGAARRLTTCSPASRA